MGRKGKRGGQPLRKYLAKTLDYKFSLYGILPESYFHICNLLFFVEGYPYDVIVTRRENEGFGFVIISSVTKAGSTIGEFIGMCHQFISFIS